MNDMPWARSFFVITGGVVVDVIDVVFDICVHCQIICFFMWEVVANLVGYLPVLHGWSESV